MGRRALRKIDPSLDLSNHLFDAIDDLPQPWSAEDLFGRKAPLEVEIGTGKGLFMRTAAADYPERDFFGVEVVRKYARFAAASLAKRELPNAKMLCGDAERLFAEVIPDETLAAVHIYFPDPWWKKRHRKRRVINERSVVNYEKKLASGGRLHFWTDVEEYFESGLEIIAANTSLDGPFDVAEAPAEHDMAYRTHFERRVRMHDEEVFRSEFRKA